MATIDPKCSIVRFVAPFLFDCASLTDRGATVDDATWPGRCNPFRLWMPQRFPQDDVLAQVAAYLNPPPGTVPTARLWELSEEALTSPRGLGAKASWLLQSPHGAVPFHLDSVQLALFGVGVGFLTFCAKPAADAVDDWLSFLHYFRFVRGQRGVRVTAELRTGRDQTVPYFPNPDSGVASPSDEPMQDRRFGEILDILLGTARLAGEPEQWWQEVFVPGQLLPYAVFYIDGLPREEIPCFAYRTRSFFHPGQELRPAPADLRLDDHPDILPYAEGSWFSFSLDGGTFLAFDAPRDHFWRATLLSHLQEEYFLLFLLALHQRFALIGFSADVADRWLGRTRAVDLQERDQAFEQIRDRLLQFTARGHFAQVMQREHHHRVYRHWQEVFQVERLYREVADEVEQMTNYLLVHRTERLERAAKRFEDSFLLIGWLIAASGFGLTFVGAVGGVRTRVAILLVVGSALLGILVWWGLRHRAGKAAEG